MFSDVLKIFSDVLRCSPHVLSCIQDVLRMFHDLKNNLVGLAGRLERWIVTNGSFN